MKRSLTDEQKAALRKKRFDVDPLNFYEPTPAQFACLQSDAIYRAIEGPNQSGKTNHAVFECGMYVRGRHPTRPWFGPVNVLVIAPSRSQLSGIWRQRLLVGCQLPGRIGAHPIIPKHEVLKVHEVPFGGGRAPGLIEMKNGSKIYFMISGDTQSWKRVQGFQFDAIVRDEAVGNENLGEELQPRLGTAQTAAAAGLKPMAGWVLWAATPTLVNTEFFEFRRLAKEGHGGIYAHFFIPPGENPAFSMEIRNRMASAMSDKAAKIRMYGTQSAGDTELIYGNQFSQERHVLAENYDPSDDDTLWVSMDPGGAGSSSHPFGVLFGVFTPRQPDQLKIVDYFQTEGQTFPNNLKIIAAWLDGRTAEAIVTDPNGVNKTDAFLGSSIESQVLQCMEDLKIQTYGGLLHGSNRHRDTIAQVQAWLDPDPDNRELPPRIVINPRCKLLITQILNYRGRPETAFTGANGVIKRNDEGPDTLRYLITKDPAYRKRAKHLRKAERPAAQSALTPEQLEHEARLRASAIRLRQLLPGRTPGIGTGTLSWG